MDDPVSILKESHDRQKHNDQSNKARSKMGSKLYEVLWVIEGKYICFNLLMAH